MLEDDFIKESLRFEQNDVLDNIFNKINQEPKTINDSWVGKVIDNKDPDKIGRCKIRVQGYYEGIEDSDIPWALPSPSFIGSLRGSFVVPQVGTLVNGHFDQGDENIPVYDGLAIHEANTKNISDKNDDYPNTMVLFETDDGDGFSVNRKSGTISLKHRSGSVITLDKSGNLTIELDNLGTGGKLNVKTKGDAKIDVGGNAEVKASGDVKVDGSRITLGKNPSSQLCNNLVSCLICGSPHQIGNTNVFV